MDAMTCTTPECDAPAAEGHGSKCLACLRCRVKGCQEPYRGLHRLCPGHQAKWLDARAKRFEAFKTSGR